jgi:hypothetical protein
MTFIQLFKSSLIFEFFVFISDQIYFSRGTETSSYSGSKISSNFNAQMKNVEINFRLKSSLLPMTHFFP